MQNTPTQNLGNQSKRIFKNRKQEIIAGVILALALYAVCFLFLPSLLANGSTAELRLQDIHVEQADARIVKSNYLAQKYTAEVLLSEAEVELAKVNQTIISLREEEMKIAEERARSISIASLGQ